MKDFYLFDLDGTLIDSIYIHIKSFKKAYEEVFGIHVDDKTFNRNAGATASTFHKSVCTGLGIKPTESQMKTIAESWLKHLKKIVESEGLEVLPGVIDFLQEIKRRGQLLGLITGNPEIVGKFLLKKAGLSDFFGIQSYSDNIRERSDVIKKALEEADKMGFETRKLVVIGDTPADIKAGKIMKGFTAGVETGPYRKDKLKEAGADLVLKNLEQYEDIFRKVG